MKVLVAYHEGCGRHITTIEEFSNNYSAVMDTVLRCYGKEQVLTRKSIEPMNSGFHWKPDNPL